MSSTDLFTFEFSSSTHFIGAGRECLRLETKHTYTHTQTHGPVKYTQSVNRNVISTVFIPGFGEGLVVCASNDVTISLSLSLFHHHRSNEPFSFWQQLSTWLGSACKLATVKIFWQEKKVFANTFGAWISATETYHCRSLFCKPNFWLMVVLVCSLSFSLSSFQFRSSPFLFLFDENAEL